MAELDQVDQQETKPFSFGQLVDIHARAQKEIPYFNGMPLPQFAQFMNQQTGTQLFNQGLHDNPIKRASAAIDRFIEPVAAKSGELGRYIAEKASPSLGNIGEEIGRGLPRGVAEMLPIGAAATIGATTPVGLGLMALGAGSMAASGYEKTDNPLVGLISGASGALTPWSAGQGRQLLTPLIKKMFYEPTMAQVGRVGVKAILPTVGQGYLTGLAERGIEAAGSNLGLLANQEAAIQASSLVQGQGFVGLTPEHAGQLIGGQVPFALLDALNIIRGPRLSITEAGETVPRNVDFRSHTQMQQVLKYSLALKKAEALNQSMDLSDTADAINRFVKTGTLADGSKPELPLMLGGPTSRQMPDAPGALVPPSTMENTVGRLVETQAKQGIRGGVAEVQNPPPVDTALYNRVLNKVQRSDELSMNDLKRLGMNQEEARQTMQRLEERGIVELATHDGPRKVVKQLTQDDEILKEASSTYFQSTGDTPVIKVGRVPVKGQTKIEGMRMGEEELTAGHLAQGSEVEQTVAQFLKKFEPTTVEKMTKPPAEMTTEERILRANELADQLLTLNREAAEGHELATALPGPEEMAKELTKLMDLGLSQPEAATRVHRMAMSRLGEVLKKVDERDAVLANAKEPGADEAYLKEHLSKLGILDVDEQKALVAVTKEPYFSVGEGTLTDRTPFVLAGGVVFKEHPELLSDYLQKVVKKHPELEGRTAYLEAMKEYAREKGHLKFYEVRKKINTASVEKLVEDGVLIPHGKTPEDALAYETASAQAEKEKETIRIAVPNGRLTQLEWYQGGAKVGLGLFRGDIEGQIKLLNGLMEKFNKGELDLVPDPKKSGELMWKAKNGWADLASSVGVTERHVRRWATEEFLPRLRGWVKLKQEEGLGLHAERSGEAQTLEQAQRESKTAGIDPMVERQSPHMGAAMVGAQRFFRTYFSRVGLSPGEIDTFTNIGVKVAAAFQDVGYTRIAEMTGHNMGLMGAYASMRRDNLNSWVVLSSHQTGGASLPFLVFKKLSTLGHELWHGMVDLARSGRATEAMRVQVDKALQWASGLSEEQRADTYDFMFRTIVPEKYRNDSKYAQDLAAGRSGIVGADAHEFLADLAGIMTLGVVSPDRETVVRSFGKELQFSGPFEQQFAKALYLPLHELVNGLGNYFKATVDKGSATPVHGTLVDITKAVTSLLKDLRYVEKAAESLRYIEQNDPENYVNLLAEAIPSPVTADALMRRYPEVFKGEKGGAAAEFLGLSPKAELEKSLGVRPGWVKRTFWPMAQLAKLYPQLQPTFDLARSFRSLVNESLTRTLVPFMGKTSTTGQVHLDMEGTGMKAIAENPELVKAVTRVFLHQNELLQDEKATPRLATEQEIRQLNPGLSDENVKHIIDFQHATAQSMAIMGNVITKFHYESIGNVAASFMMAKNRALTYKEAVGLGREVAAIARVLGDQNAQPRDAQMAMERLGQVKQKIGLNAFEASVSYADKVLPQVQKLEKLFASRTFPDGDGTPMSPFTPEVRLGQYHVAWKKPDGTTGLYATDKVDEALAKKREVEKTGASVRLYDKYDKQNLMSGVHQDVVDVIKDIHNAAAESLLKSFVGTKEYDELRDLVMAPMDAAMKEVKGQSVVGRHFLQRKLAEGREDLNIVRGVIEYINGVSYGLSKRSVREQGKLAVRDPELTQNPKLQEIARQHLSNVIDPTGKEWTALKNLNFAYFLGFNISSMLIESSQGVMTLVPQLTRDSGSVAKSYEYWGSAVKDFVAAVKNKGEYVDQEMNDAVKRAKREQRIDYGIMQEFHTFDENVLLNLRNLGQETGWLSGSDLVKKPLYWYLHASRWLYSHFPRANAQVAFVSAWKLAKEKGMTRDQAYDYAAQTVDATMFGGGSAGRPVGMFYNKGNLQGAVGILYSLGTYTYSTIAMMARLGEEAISTKLPAEQRLAARKAFGQMLLTQVAMGGAMSLPIAPGVVALIEEMFPEVELKKGAKAASEAFGKLLTNDDEMGHLVSDVALKGLPTLLGQDLSGRVGLSSILGVSPYNGFSLGGLVGPTGSVIQNVTKALSEGSQGQYGEAVQSLLPQAYKNVVRLMNDDWDVRDKAGRLVQPLTDTQRLLYSVGLKPKEVGEYQEEQGMVQKSETNYKNELDRFHKGLAGQLTQGDIGGVRSALLSKAQIDPLYSAVRGAERVVELAQDQTIPVDLTRSGVHSGAIARSDIATMYGHPPQPTETQRLLQKKGLSTQLGIPGAGVVTPLELNQAQMVDQLMRSNPRMTRQEALLMIQKVMQPNSPDRRFGAY